MNALNAQTLFSYESIINTLIYKLLNLLLLFNLLWFEHQTVRKKHGTKLTNEAKMCTNLQVANFTFSSHSVHNLH